MGMGHVPKILEKIPERVQDWCLIQLKSKILSLKTYNYDTLKVYKAISDSLENRKIINCIV